jgi:hypothetical protein
MQRTIFGSKRGAAPAAASYLAKQVPVLFLPCAEVLDCGEQPDRRYERLVPRDDSGHPLPAVLVAKK